MKLVRPKSSSSILESEFLKIPFYGRASKQAPASHIAVCFYSWLPVEIERQSLHLPGRPAL